jgi:acyl-CoA reductase-like NAD-dependent aldehyde dehydrogenase
MLDRIRNAKFFQTIDGAAVGSVYEDVIDPSTGMAFQKSPVATADDIDAAVASARRAQPAWAALSWDERAGYLERLADAIDGEREWIAAVQTMEQGMPFPESVMSVTLTARRLRIIGAVRVTDRILIEDSGRRVTERWSPLGIVAAIAPWNGPLVLGMIKVATALIGGNAVVLKPSELTPLGTLEIGRIARAILPPGIFNVLGGGRDVGQAMVAHPGFDKVSFTGSTAAGISIAKQSAAYLRSVLLELGGNDAAILLADGSVADLVASAARTAFVNCGQYCAAIKRVYTPPGLYDQVCEGIAAAARTMKLGNGFEPGVNMGPIQNKAQFDKVCAIVEDAKAAGGRVLTGGAPLPGNGYFYPPTVIADLTDGVRLVDEEQFGPVVPVVKYTDLDQVIEQINKGPYGLTGSVWTADLQRGEQIAARLAVGTGWVNQHGLFDPAVPFPMIKASGMGVDYADYGVKGAMRLQAIHTKKPAA